jgi:signal transduction histidine kinase
MTEINLQQPADPGSSSALPTPFSKPTSSTYPLSRLQELGRTVNQDLKARIVKSILSIVTDGILFIDLEGYVREANESALRILGIKSEIVDKKYGDLFPDDQFGFSMREALKFGLSHRLLYISHPPKELEISTIFVYEGLKGMILRITDRTEKEKVLASDAQGNRLKELGQMAAGLAHEVRNPLGGIRGYASLLTRDLEGDKHLQEMAQSICDAAKTLEKLTARILTFARPLKTSPRSMEVGIFLKQLVKHVLVDPAYPPNVKIETHIPNDALLAPIDPDSLKLALLNLVFNAFQAMPQGGKLTLSLLKLEGCFQLSVSDTGIGMDEETQKALFSPYFTTKKRGNGLGLVEVQKIVAAHRGRIDVLSSLGKGSSFLLTLPLRRSAHD